MDTTRHKPVRKAAEVLARLLSVPQSSVRLLPRDPDVLAVGRRWTFAVRDIRYGTAGHAAIAAEAARKRASELGSDVIPLVVAPFMSNGGHEQCEAAGVAWLDLSGNARILAPGIHIVTLGHPNQFKRSGRPSSVFAPKSARIARWLLMNTERAWTQRELAQATNMDEGFVSRIVGRLAEDKLVVRSEDGAVSARDPHLLLDAWAEDYRFEKHRIRRGHVAARTGDALLRGLAETIDKAGVEYAATGLGAAWLLTRFAGFQLASFYLQEPPTPALLSQLKFREEERGANVWLIVPNDAGVFHGAARVDAVACVHPVQAYLDLGAHPERAGDAAAELRTGLLNRKLDG